MITLRRLVFVCVCAAIALFLYVKLRPSAPEGPGPITAVPGAVSAGAERIEITEPITLSHVPQPGDTWTQTSIMRGHQEQHSSGESLAFDLEIRLVSQSRAREGASPGEIIVEHTVENAMITFHNPAWPEEIAARQSEVLRERETSLQRAEVRETLSPEGQRISAEIWIPEMPPHSTVGSELLLSSLFTMPPAIGAPQLTAGSTWTVTEHLPSIPGVPIQQVNTLDHLEDRNGVLLAVVRSESTAQFQASGSGGVALGSVTEPDRGTADFSLERLEINWQGEDRYRLSDGVRIEATSQCHHDVGISILLSELSGRRWTDELSAALDLEVTTAIEPAQ